MMSWTPWKGHFREESAMSNDFGGQISWGMRIDH